MLKQSLSFMTLALGLVALTSTGLRPAVASDVPTITKFQPGSGPVGTSVYVFGTAFIPSGTEVKFNGTLATPVTVNSTGTTLGVKVPAGATTGPIGVKTSVGAALSATSFIVTATAAPSISNFSPASGPVGTVVTLRGTNLSPGPVASPTLVKFNGVAATSVKFSESRLELIATVPDGATSGPITVTTPDGSAASATPFTVLAAPTITSFKPAKGAIGASVTILGSNFAPGATTVKFNGVAATVLSVNAEHTSLIAKVGAGTTTGPISVTTAQGTATSSTPFTVIGAPTITGFTPHSGPVGTTVTITGTGFVGDVTGVRFNTAEPVPATVNSEGTLLTVKVPPAATTGKLTVLVAGVSVVSADIFTVTATETTPIIFGFYNSSGPVGATVTVAGRRFTGATAVRFGGVAATFTVNAEGTVITAKVPVAAINGPITVTTPGGTAESLGRFMLAPRIDGFTPTSGAVATVVTVNVINLYDPTLVSINGIPVPFTVSGSHISFKVPPGATSGNISVVTATGQAVSAGSFTVTP